MTNTQPAAAAPASSAPPTAPERDTDFRLALEACKRILIKLQQLSDAPTGRMQLEGVAEHGSHTDRLRTRDHQPLPGRGTPSGTSRIPQGVSSNVERGHAPSKRLSLWAHYIFRMQTAAKAGDPLKLLELAVAATRDYEEYTGKRRASQHEYHKGAVDELLRDYTGVAAHEAAVWLRCPEKWVRRQRVLNGRDAEYGEARDHDERTVRILALAEAGGSSRTIAAEVGVSRMTVHRIRSGLVPVSQKG